MPLSPIILDKRDTVTNYFAERFGIPASVFDPYLLLEAGKSYWALMRSEGVEEFLHLKRVEYLGVRLLRKTGRFLKPTTYGLQRFGENASKNIIRLSGDQLKGLINDDEGIEDVFDSGEGYVILAMGDVILGCGLKLDGRLRHCFPKGRAKALALSGLF